MIPKKIHFCWFGGKTKSDLVQFCIRSWREYCEDYEIVEWNEDNFDLGRFPFAQIAFNRKKFAFVSDLVRAYALHEHGGVYLDSDVEIRRSLDEFLVHRAFTGFQERGIPFTALWGSEPGHSLAKKVLTYYDLADPDKVIDVPNVWFIRDMLRDSFNVDPDHDRFQIGRDGLTIYPSSHFCANLPLNFSVHHFAGSWLEHELPTHYSNTVLASFYLNALREMERKGIKLDITTFNTSQDVSFKSDLDRLRWHIVQVVSVFKRRLRLKAAAVRRNVSS